MKVAVIGAGLAGLTAARQLLLAGKEVTIFDKSKGTGGRLSSRSHGSGWVDHGAPYLTTTSEDFERFLHSSPAGAKAQQWQPSISGTLMADEQSNFIGVPRNSALTRALTEGLRFQPSTRIARLEKSPSGWQLYNDGETLMGGYSQLVLAVPSPQALALLRPLPDISDKLEAVKMEPCWVAAIQSAQEVKGLADVTTLEHPVVRRITRNSAKPGRDNKNLYLLQATKGWSLEHLEETAEDVGTELLRHFTGLTSEHTKAELLFVHRWRYAFTEQPLGESYLWSPELQLGVCGDWCLGRTAEHAWQSGSALAARILEQELVIPEGE